MAEHVRPIVRQSSTLRRTPNEALNHPLRQWGTVILIQHSRTAQVWMVPKSRGEPGRQTERISVVRLSSMRPAPSTPTVARTWFPLRLGMSTPGEATETANPHVTPQLLQTRADQNHDCFRGLDKFQDCWLPVLGVEESIVWRPNSHHLRRRSGNIPAFTSTSRRK